MEILKTETTEGQNQEAIETWNGDTSERRSAFVARRMAEISLEDFDIQV